MKPLTDALRVATILVALLVLATGAPAAAPAGADDAPPTAGAADDAQPQPERRRRRGPRPDAPPADEAAPDADAPDAADDEAEAEDLPQREHDWLAIVGGTVHTVTRGVHPGTTILCRDGRIHAIGRDVHVPEDATVVDATGMNVYPGLVAVDTRGLVGGGNPADSTDPYAFTMTLGLAAGVTTGLSGTTAAKLTFGTLDDHVLRTDLFEDLSYDTDNPRRRLDVREGLERVRQLLRDLEAYERSKDSDPDATKPDEGWVRGAFQTYRRLLEGDAVARMRANDVHELLQACALAEDFGLDIVVTGAHEGWIVADELGRAGIAAIVTPRTEIGPDRALVRESGATVQNAAILRAHGVPVAVTPSSGGISLSGLAGRDLQHLAMEAAFAVRGGLSNAEAIEAITIDAARILGVDDRVGSIEVGKDADFAIADGDLLHYMTLVQKTIVNGRLAYDKDADTLFAHIRPAADPDAPPPADYWPRRLGDGP